MLAGRSLRLPKISFIVLVSLVPLCGLAYGFNPHKKRQAGDHGFRQPDHPWRPADPWFADR